MHFARSSPVVAVREVSPKYYYITWAMVLTWYFDEGRYIKNRELQLAQPILCVLNYLASYPDLKKVY